MPPVVPAVLESNAAPRGGAAAQFTSAYGALSREVRDAGLLRRAYGYYLAVAVALAVALGGVVTAFVLLGDSWFQLLVAAVLGVVLTQLAFLTHETAHRQVFASGPLNDRVGRILANAVVGISYSWWMTKHTRHHANPNHVGKDPDVAPGVISFTAEAAADHRGFLGAITRRQGWLFFPLLTLEGLNLHVTAVRSLMTGPPEDRGARRRELATILVRLTVYVAVIFWWLPLGLGFAFLGVQLAVFGVYMGATFAPNHKGMTMIPEGSRIDFLSKQVLTSRNVTGGAWMSVLMGGLNLQVEHHLFPSMPRPHLARARLIVREHCARLGMPYTETSLLRSYAIVVRYLNEVGLAARDPFDCPMRQQLGRR
ncbi:fatty acid desaturase family protein [Krasilnikoviella flava]|uniref:Fatty acid desaturase n=1 Tax=Krasilnikoviella flava TaxID=526729 RepID=A0A1T5KU30_9MICO|nr:acyl-CoA desaturase [Krasilnikoviella flava]SKC67201.1 Fatty acid desaturase [Krasilnikoviella flava]